MDNMDADRRDRRVAAVAATPGLAAGGGASRSGSQLCNSAHAEIAPE